MKLEDLNKLPKCIRCHKYFTSPKELEKHLTQMRKENDFFHYPQGVDDDKVKQ